MMFPLRASDPLLGASSDAVLAQILELSLSQTPNFKDEDASKVTTRLPSTSADSMFPNPKFGPQTAVGSTTCGAACAMLPHSNANPMKKKRVDLTRFEIPNPNI